MEFGSPVMLRVTDMPQGGLMQERQIEGVWVGSRFNTLEHLASRRSDGRGSYSCSSRNLSKSSKVGNVKLHRQSQQCQPVDPIHSGQLPVQFSSRKPCWTKTRPRPQLWQVQRNPEGPFAKRQTKAEVDPLKMAIDESKPDPNKTDTWQSSRYCRQLVLHRCSATIDGDSRRPGCRRN